MQELLEKVINKINLNETESSQVMDFFTSGNASNIYMSAMLIALKMKNESVDEIAGFVKVMRDKATRIKTPNNQKILDIVGTGGDHSNTFNISTLSAIVAAGAGITVAKHGNRSVTSNCGSAEVLSKLGVRLEASPETIEKALAQTSLAFLFAPSLHPSMKHVMPVRKELKTRTVFNILGPLANPAFADTMLVGVYSPHLLEIFSKVLSKIGVKRSLVVHGNDSTDEISLTTTTQIIENIDGNFKSYTFDPRDYGFNLVSSDSIQGGDPDRNKEIALAILNGEKSAKRDIVILNAGLAIALTLENFHIEQGINLAKDSLDSGKALKKLQELIKITNE
jgi:anthranilate phosphoribosyltransferase